MEQSVIKVQGKIPRDVGIAVSGGIDSMAVLDFLRRNHNVTVYNFDHGTLFGEYVTDYIVRYCKENNLPYKIGWLTEKRPRYMSKEEHWRNERYKWLTAQNQTIVLAHHLDDCVESWIFNMCNGKDYTIPYRHANCIRPFRLTPKIELEKWINQHEVKWANDPSNSDTTFKRNYIRHSVVPVVMGVNPGLPKVIAKRIAAESVE
mgnify:CR=1 FL=1